MEIQIGSQLEYGSLGQKAFTAPLGLRMKYNLLYRQNLFNDCFKRFLANSSNFFGMRYILQQQRANLPHHIGVGHFLGHLQLPTFQVTQKFCWDTGWGNESMYYLGGLMETA